MAKRVYHFILVFIMLLATGFFCIRDLQLENYMRLFSYLFLLPLLFLPKISEKIFSFSFDRRLKVLYFTFVFLAYFLGGLASFYVRFHWYNTFVHSLFGFLGSFFAIALMKQFFPADKKFFYFLFSLAFICLLAVFWEVFEYLVDFFQGTSMQHVFETGIHDTMIDFLVALGGNILFSFFFFFSSSFYHFATTTRFLYKK